MNFCSSVFNCNVKISKVLCLGKKIANKHRPLLLGFEHYGDKVSILSHTYLLCHNDQYSDVFIVPDRTKFEREKHKKLVAERKERHTKGESSLIIRNGAIVARPPWPGSNSTTNVTITILLSHPDGSFNKVSIDSLKVLYTNADQFLNKVHDLQTFIAGDEPDLILISELLPKNRSVLILLI